MIPDLFGGHVLLVYFSHLSLYDRALKGLFFNNTIIIDIYNYNLKLNFSNITMFEDGHASSILFL